MKHLRRYFLLAFVLFGLILALGDSPAYAFLDGVAENFAEDAKKIGDSVTKTATDALNGIGNAINDAAKFVQEKVNTVVNFLKALLRVRVYMPLALFANTLSTSLAQLFSGVLSDTRWALRTFLLHYFARSLPETEAQVRAIIPAAGELIRLSRVLAGGISILSLIFTIAIGSTALITLSSEGFANVIRNTGKVIVYAFASQIAPVFLLLAYGVANQFTLELCGGLKVCANRIDLVNMLIPGPTENPIVQIAAMIVGVVFTGFIAISALLNSLAAFFAYAMAPIGVASKGLPATGVVYQSWRDIALRVIIVHVIVALLILAAARYAAMVQDRVGKMAIVLAIGLLILLITGMSLALNIGSAANFATSAVASISQSFDAAGQATSNSFNHALSAGYNAFNMGGAEHRSAGEGGARSAFGFGGGASQSTQAGSASPSPSGAVNFETLRSRYRMHTVSGMVSEAVDTATGRQGVARMHAASGAPTTGSAAVESATDEAGLAAAASRNDAGVSAAASQVYRSPSEQFAAAAPSPTPAGEKSPSTPMPTAAGAAPTVGVPGAAGNMPGAAAIRGEGQAASLVAMANGVGAQTTPAAASTGAAAAGGASGGATVGSAAAGGAGAAATGATVAGVAVAATKIAHDIHEASEIKREGVESIARKVGADQGKS